MGVHYQFRSANVAGFPAEFDLRFANTPRKANLGGREIVIDEYQPVYQSKVLYSISVP